MWLGVKVLLVMALGSLTSPVFSYKNFNITIGYLPCITGGRVRDCQAQEISGALSLALDEVNNDSSILPDVRIMMESRDNKHDTITSTRQMVDMICSGVVAFFGPEGHCNTESIIAQSRNLPMFSHKCSDQRQPSRLSSFLRLDPSHLQATKSVISLLRYYRWHKFSILYEESWMSVAEALQNYASNENMTVNHISPAVDSFKCCEERLACCAPGFWYHFVQETKNQTRIYVFLGTTSGLIDLMDAMESQQMFNDGLYMVIFVDMVPYGLEDSSKYLIGITRDNTKNICSDISTFIKRSQSLIVISLSEVSSSYEEFSSKVRQYSAWDPSKFPYKSHGYNKLVPIYAAYLYDSIKLYAKALDEIIKEETAIEPLSQTKLSSIVNNGYRIISEIISRSPHTSVSGCLINFDEYGDAEGRFISLGSQPIRNASESRSCNYTMLPVGEFRPSFKYYPEYKPNFRRPIDWAGGIRPEDEPACGYNNANCPAQGIKVKENDVNCRACKESLM